MAYFWRNKSVSPSIKLRTGIDASGNIMLVSVSIRNTDPDILTSEQKRQALQNIITAFRVNDIFDYPMQHVIVSGSWTVLYEE